MGEQLVDDDEEAVGGRHRPALGPPRDASRRNCAAR
jgi:hypothetical protein